MKDEELALLARECQRFLAAYYSVMPTEDLIVKSRALRAALDLVDHSPAPSVPE